MPCLCQHSLDELAVDVGEAEIAALVFVGEPRVVDAEEMQDRGVEVVDVDAVGRDVVAEVVGGSNGGARLDASSRRPKGEAAGVMIAAVVGGGPPVLFTRISMGPSACSMASIWELIWSRSAMSH